MMIGRTTERTAVIGTGRRRPRPARAGFGFGIEAEYLLAEAGTYRPLPHRELDFEALNAALEATPTADLPTVDGLKLEPPHRQRMPFYVEGYHVPDPSDPSPTLLPKGVEVRTPVCGTPEEAVALLTELVGRLQRSLDGIGLRAVALSHHPTEDRFDGPRGRRTFERWRWAREAMLTCGPDVNVSLPGRLVPDDLDAKVNAYAPSLALLSLASPLRSGGPWRVDGRVGKSARTHRRSEAGRALRRHDDQPGRLEFKSFEMSQRPADLHGYLLLWLALLLDDGLGDRATDRERIDDLRAVAVDGLAVVRVRDRAAEVLDHAPSVLAARDFDPAPLEPLADRLATGRLPADEILDLYRREGTIAGVLRHLDATGDAARATASALAC